MVAAVIVGGVGCTLRVGVASCTLGVGVTSCTLGVGMVSCTLGVCVSMRTLGVGGVPDAGFSVGSKVTLCIVVRCVGVGCSMGILFINSSNFCNALSSIAPLCFIDPSALLSGCSKPSRLCPPGWVSVL